MKLSRAALKQLVQEEMTGLLEAEIWQQEPDSSYAETAPGRKEKVGPWKQIGQHVSGKGAKKLGWTPDQAGEFAKSKPVGHISSELTDTQKSSTKGGGSQFIQDVSTSRGDPGAGPVRVSNKEYNIGSQEWKKAAMMKEPEFRATHPGKDYDPRDVVDRSVQQYSTKGGDVQNVQTFGRERTPASALQRQRDVQQYKAAAAADDVAAGIEESTMKLSRNDLKQLVQEEMTGLLEAAQTSADIEARGDDYVTAAPEKDWAQTYSATERYKDGKDIGAASTGHDPKRFTRDDARTFAKEKPSGHVDSVITQGSKEGSKSGSKTGFTSTSRSRGDTKMKSDIPGYVPYGGTHGDDVVTFDQTKAAGQTTPAGKRGSTSSTLFQQFKNLQTGAAKQRAQQQWKKEMKESTMKLSRNDLKSLIQEELGVLLEQPAAAGVDTSAVQQSGKVTQILRIIDGMREDEISALLTAMKSAGLPIAM